MPKKSSDTGEPRFPYTTEPKALRRLLTEIPKRPKPPKVSLDTLKAWNVSKNTNSRTAIAVLKKLGLLGPSGEPVECYVEFMKTGTGPAALATRIKEVYKVLFENCHAPQTESVDELKKLFHIHSGGGDFAMRLQVQTFKAPADHANFAAGTDGASGNGRAAVGVGKQDDEGTGSGQQLPPIRVDLHIHLPENKTSRDYEAIIQDIARYIYGRDIERS
jgi:hypothetical protein